MPIPTIQKVRKISSRIIVVLRSFVSVRSASLWFDSVTHSYSYQGWKDKSFKSL